MKKVCWLSWHFDTPEIFLNSIKKMTPNSSGKWKDMVAVTDPFQADFCAILDGYNGKFPQDRAIYFGEHPEVQGERLSPAFRTFQNNPCLARISLDKYLNFGEWWINYTYDELSALKRPQKPKNTACIMTYQTHNPMYAQRVKFMENFVNSMGHKGIDLFGRPQEKFLANETLKTVYKCPLGKNNPDGKKNEHTFGKEGLVDYRYSLEFDVGPTRNYISERFYDALLLWTLPIYFGSNNVHKFVPSSAFHYVDIHNTSNNNLNKIKDILEIDWTHYPHIVKDIEHARDLLLNRYQMWPYLWHVINNLEDYK